MTGLLERRTTALGAAAPVQDMSYVWNKEGTLKSRQDMRSGVTLLEEFEYDTLYRLDRTKVNGSYALGLDVTIDAIGNITYKSDVGTYTYSPTRKHAVVSAGSRTFAYDANGNMNARDGYSIDWYSYDLPSVIRGPSGTSSEFQYGADRERWEQVAVGPAGTETTTYIGKAFERVQDPDGTTAYRHYIFAADGPIAIATRRSTGTNSVEYLTRDHLGSADTVSDGAGWVTQRLSYDPFGGRRNPTTWSGPTTPPPVGTNDLGYTGHEHLDNLGLVHMNGRVFDPALGRFMSADPFVSEPYFAQSLNRYAYVYNNPLSYADPSGFVPTVGGPSAADRLPPRGLDFSYGYYNGGGPPLFQAGKTYEPYKVTGAVAPSAPKINAVAIGRNVASIGVGFVPVLGSVQSFVELISGKDYITGEKTSRVLAGAGIILGLVGAKGFLKAGEKIARHSDEIADAARTLTTRATCCFVAGTLVMTKDGLRPIEEVEVGDEVLSRDETTGETAFKPVVELIRRHDRQIWELELQVIDGSGLETFETTDDHPWRTMDGRWAATAELQPGSLIQRASGAPAMVVSVVKTDRTAPTFNFEVADFHSYFVGEAGVWVHNAKCDWAARGFGKAPEFFGGKVSETEFLNAAEKWLGPGYKSLPNGRYLSADGLRQVRYGKHEVRSAVHHGHFEAYDRAGGAVIENTWVEITP